MLLGVMLHGSLSFVTFPWIVHDTQRSDPLFFLWIIVHGFRMPLFFLLSGYFTMLVYQRRGLKDLLQQRFQRIFVPLVVAALTIGLVDGAIDRYAQRAIPAEPAVAEILHSDVDAVRQRMAEAGETLQQDSFWRRSFLAWATMHGDPAIVEAIMDASGDRDQQVKRGNEESLLHTAAYFGNDAVAKLLLERGVDPRAENSAGNMPSAALSISADAVSMFAPYLGLNGLPVDDVLRGRAQLRELLPTVPNPETTRAGMLDRLALANSRLQSSEHLRVRLGGESIHLIQTDVFDHLWFLWFLCWMVAIFAMLAALGRLPSGRARGWLMVASCLPQSLMFMSLIASFGPDTSIGIIPKPHVLAYYGCFFFYGVAEYSANGIETEMGRSWKRMLIAAFFLFAAGIVTINNRMLATALQPAYAWTMSMGLIGLFGRFFSKPHPATTWMADASYWMYLAHLPLVLGAQLLVREWALPAELKFIVVLSLVIPLLLLSYRFGVRYTVIGRWLNGPRSMVK